MRQFIICLFFTLIQFPSLARIAARVEYACFPAAQKGGRLFLVIGLDGSSLKYRSVEGKGFQASVSFILAVNDSSRNYFAERQEIETPVIADSSQMARDYSFVKEIELPYGQFSVDILSFEKQAQKGDTVRARFSIEMENPGEKITASELLLVENASFKPQIHIFQQDIPAYRTTDFYSRKDTLLSFYGEISGLNQHMKTGSTYISRYRILEANTRRSLDEFGKIQRIRYREQLSQKMDFNIRLLPTGKYLLVWDLVDSTLKVLARTEKVFTKSNPDLKPSDRPGYQQKNEKLDQLIATLSEADCRMTVASLLPLSRASEQPTIEYLRKKGTEAELRSYISTFFNRHEPENPYLSLLTFRELMAIGAKKYATKAMPAYQTDRGRVLLQYGQPNMIENEYSDRFRKAMQNLNTVPYEVWYYYNLEKPVKQNDVIFVFVQENRGNENYRLIHSTGIGEVRNREWRKVVETNATYNYDRMDPNDRYDPNDAKKFR